MEWSIRSIPLAKRIRSSGAFDPYKNYSERLKTKKVMDQNRALALNRAHSTDPLRKKTSNLQKKDPIYKWSKQSKLADCLKGICPLNSLLYNDSWISPSVIYWLSDFNCWFYYFCWFGDLKINWNIFFVYFLYLVYLLVQSFGQVVQFWFYWIFCQILTVWIFCLLDLS